MSDDLHRDLNDHQPGDLRQEEGGPSLDPSVVEPFGESSSPIFRITSKEIKSHPEQLDVLLEVVPSYSWAACATILALMALGIIWVFFGSLPISVEGRGIFMTREGAVTVQTTIDGVVKVIYVRAGELLEKGALIAEIYDPREKLKFEAAKAKVAILTKNLEQLRQDIETEGKAIKSGIESELQAKAYTIKQKEQNLAVLKQDLEKKALLLKEGLISANTYNEQEAKIAQENIETETVKAAAENLKASLLKGYRKEELVQKESELFKAEEEWKLLESTLDASRIYSPIEGRVLEVFVRVGDLLAPGQAVAWIETPRSDKNQMVVYGYFPVNEGKQLSPGEEVQIFLLEGSMPGKIANISPFPISSEQLLKIFHSKDLGEYLTPGASAVLFILIEPDVAAMNKNSQLRILANVSSGTVATLRTVVKHVRPIYYLLPLESSTNESQE